AGLSLPAGAKVLEVGCGPGLFWERAADQLPADLDITLTDLSPGMVEEARQRVAGLGRWSQVKAQVADVCALPFVDAGFDIVLAMHMLYHASDPDLALVEIARVLRLGGVLVASTNGLDNLSALFVLGQRAFGGPRGDRGAAAFSLDGGEAMLARHFAEVEIRRSRDEMRITDPADVIAYLTSFPPGDGADPDALQRLEQEVQAAFAEGGGVLSVTRDTGYLIGRGPKAAR
ncbi:MAG TPA: class I SAM-dependent methyltransferase, partial [Caulobacteraceae bacterium]|nr:class I SAM-dependent methyltransferase [Caulobacteraceae bacterium]